MSSRGFTLVELLAALLVLSIMIALVGTLLRSFILQMGKTRYTYAERAMKFYWLNSAINSMFYYTIRTPDRILTENKEFIEFFNGQPESMTFITSSPLTLKGVALDRLYFKDDAVYLNETPIFSPNNDYANPRETAETKQTRILDKVHGIRYAYSTRARRVRATGQGPIEGLDSVAALTSVGKILVVPGRETDRLDGEIPEGVKLSVTFDDDRKMDYYFKVQSNFQKKKEMTFGRYHQL